MKIKPHNIEWNIEGNIISFWDPILNTGWSLNEVQSKEIIEDIEFLIKEYIEEDDINLSPSAVIYKNKLKKVILDEQKYYK